MRPALQAAEPVGGPIQVRPPALVEAAQGVRAAARAADESAARLERCLAATADFGAAQVAFAGMGRGWLTELRQLMREAGDLSAAVEVAASDYLRTDAEAVGSVA